MHRPCDITLYVPCFNAEQTIGQCVESLRSQSIRPHRILLIDDGSAVPVSEIVRDPVVEALRHKTNRGLGASRNTALAACDTPLLASVDADVVADSDWLEHLLLEVNQHQFAGVGGRMDEAFQDTLANRWRARHMAQHWGDKPVQNPRFLFGCNTLFRTDALHEVNGYDNRLRTNDEDRLICEALRIASHELGYTPKAHCCHLRRDGLNTILGGYWQWHQARGLLRGDFASLAGILRRIDEVNFGIYRYRFDIDRAAGAEEFLGLDAAIPWVFCALDVAMFARQTGEPCSFPFEELLAVVDDQVAAGLRAVMPRNINPHAANSHCDESYVNRFQECLLQSQWLARAEHVVPLGVAETPAEASFSAAFSKVRMSYMTSAINAAISHHPAA